MKIKYLAMGIISVVVFFLAVGVAIACYQPPQIELCLDDSALNYNQALPCEYPPKCEEGQILVDNECITPEPPREEPPVVCTENCGTPPTFAGSTTNPPAGPTCTIQFEVARTWYDNGELKWATDAQGIQKFSITYGPDKDHLIYGIDNIVPTARAVARPESDFNQTWFSVWTWVNDCANQSPPIDP